MMTKASDLLSTKPRRGEPLFPSRKHANYRGSSLRYFWIGGGVPVHSILHSGIPETNSDRPFLAELEAASSAAAGVYLQAENLLPTDGR
jgi:hypothetical protein